jgi:Mg2+-importing ATPase
MGLVRQFMIRVGLVSSVFDLITFAVLLRLFRSTPALFRTGWFVESIVTQALVMLVIRTTGNPFRNRPSKAVMATVLAAATIGTLLPYSPLRGVLGFVIPPPAFLLYVAATTIAYLMSVELVKRRLVPRLLA